MVLGGLIFSYLNESEKKTNEDTEQNATFSINSKYNYVMAIKLNYKKTDETKFKFGDVKSAFYPAGYKMIIDMENQSAKIVNIETITYKVLDKKDNVVFDGEVNNFKMAPKTKVGMPLNWGAPSFDQDEYKIVLTAIIDGEEFTKTTMFSVKEPKSNSKGDKETFFKNPLDNTDNNQSLLMWVNILLLLIISILLIILIKKRKKKDDNTEVAEKETTSTVDK